ncbi:hypothetical protein EDC01DRAFT_629248 [Geopyxis carbonaria]|nr:hypothetical protein EDC01DRAFT_629248 [Geopyxis carbonaria]
MDSTPSTDSSDSSGSTDSSRSTNSSGLTNSSGSTDSSGSTVSTVPLPRTPITTVPLPWTPPNKYSWPSCGGDLTPYTLQSLDEKFPPRRRYRHCESSPPPSRETTPTPSAPRRRVAPALPTATVVAPRVIRRKRVRIARGRFRRDLNRVGAGPGLVTYRRMMRFDVAVNKAARDRASRSAISTTPALVVAIYAAPKRAVVATAALSPRKCALGDCDHFLPNPYKWRKVIDLTSP